MRYFVSQLIIDPSTSNQAVLVAAGKLMREKYDIYSLTIQVEDYQPSVSANCEECQRL